MNTKHNENPDEYDLVATIKDELGKSANKAINVDIGVHENKFYRNYEQMEKRRKKLTKKEITPIKFMKNILRSVIYHDVKLAAMKIITIMKLMYPKMKLIMLKPRVIWWKVLNNFIMELQGRIQRLKKGGGHNRKVA